jgi:hypothetical protein
MMGDSEVEERVMPGLTRSARNNFFFSFTIAHNQKPTMVVVATMVGS